MKEDTPNSKNFCGGNFQDWLEINLLETCNAHCAWCIERNGYHPKYHASVDIIAKMAIESDKTNIILLGGEPLLYKNMKKLVELLVEVDKKIWITTNGFLLTEKYITENLIGIRGVNISIHHFDMEKNKEITGIKINEDNLIKAISLLHSINVHVRMNCNVIMNQIDDATGIAYYSRWAKKIGADKIRFAELKQDDENFIDLAEILDHKYGLNDNPFLYGCNSDCVIFDMPVNFRQMCGLQTSRRIAPLNPKQIMKQVLYYDGKMYNGWQTNQKENKMKDSSKNSMKNVLNLLTNKKLKEDELTALMDYFETITAEKNVESKIKDDLRLPSFRESESTGGCQY